MGTQVDWYFDYISPYPYLQLARFNELPDEIDIIPIPVLFAGLLNHWGHKGPAEIPAKALQTYYYTNWLAKQRGLEFAGPPRHPFNPLAVLRITIANGSTLDTVRTIYQHIWGNGNDGQSEESLNQLADKLGIDDLDAVLTDPDYKDMLKTNTNEAISRGVYGVPTFAINDQLFWGDDATPMLVEYINNPALFDEWAGKASKVMPAAQRTAPQP
jgi:2-hydroxychromene-2-carboxylate isomerase